LQGLELRARLADELKVFTRRFVHLQELAHLQNARADKKRGVKLAVVSETEAQGHQVFLFSELEGCAHTHTHTCVTSTNALLSTVDSCRFCDHSSTVARLRLI
jgi:hypothetical protein